MARPRKADLGPPPTAQARAVLALVTAATLLVMIDITIVTVGLPRIQAELGGTVADVQWVLIAYTITMGAVNQVVGSMSDQLGRRRIYLVGIVVFTVASLACGLSQSTLMLDVFRGVQGIGGAILMTNAMPLIRQEYEGQRFTRAIAVWGTVATGVGMIAPVLGGLLIDALNWRWMFLINVPIGVLAFAMAAARLPADQPTERRLRGLDWGGTVLLIASLALINLALLRGADQGWGSTPILVEIPLAAILFGWFIRVQLRVSAPTLDLRLFRMRMFSGAAIAIFMSRALIIGGTVFLIQYSQESLHLTPTQSGLLLTPLFVAQMGAGLLSGRLLAWIPPGLLLAGGNACRAGASLWLALMISPTTNPWLLAFPLLLLGLGGGFAGVPVMSIAMNAVEKQRAGMASGVMASLAGIGAGIGIAVLGVLYQQQLDDPGNSTPAQAVSAGAAAVLFTSAILGVITVIAVLLLVRKTAENKDPTDKTQDNEATEVPAE